MHFYYFLNTTFVGFAMNGDFRRSCRLLLLVLFLLVLLMQGPVDLKIEKVLLFDDVSGRVNYDVSVSV